MTPDFFLIKSGRLFCSNVRTAGSDDCCFSKIAIDKDSDGIKAAGFWEFHDKIHGNSGERSGVGFRSDGLETRTRTIGEILGFLASCTTINIVVDEATNARPIKGASDQVKSFETTRMTGSRGIMMEANYVAAEVRVMGNVDAMRIKNKAILNRPLFLKVGF